LESENSWELFIWWVGKQMGRFRFWSLWAWCLYLVTHFVITLWDLLIVDWRAALSPILGHIGPNWVNKAWCVCSSLLLLILIDCLCLWCCSTLGFRAVYCCCCLKLFIHWLSLSLLHTSLYSFIGVIYWTVFTTILKN